VHKKTRKNCHGFQNFSNLELHNKAGNTANYQAGDISRRKEVKEKRPSPFLFPFSRFANIVGTGTHGSSQRLNFLPRFFYQYLCSKLFQGP
jgi:hypothetical protein